MPRITELGRLMFPVAEWPVTAHLKTWGGEMRVPVPGHKAIVNQHTGTVLGIVGRGYRLVSNRDALQMAKLCCQTVFPETKPIEWEVQAADAPGTAGYCRIDLAHRSAALDFSHVLPEQRPEAFGPFLRVTNSYNGLRALAFDIGFYRKVCKNGMVWPESVVRFRFTHSRRELGETIEFEAARDKLTTFRSKFEKYLGALRNCTVRHPQFAPFLLDVLELAPPGRLKKDPGAARDWGLLCQHVDTVCERYVNELGENAYAAFNAITDFASHPPTNPCLHRERHSMQRLAGAWLGNFSRICHQPGFQMADYLQKLARKRSEVVANGTNGGPPMVNYPRETSNLRQ